MGLKVTAPGHFTIPTAPAAGTSCTSGLSNVFTTTYVQLIASTSAATFITGVHLEAAAAKAATYIIVQLATGGAGSEAVVGQYLVPLSTASTVALGYRQIYPPILVPVSTRIACKTADSVGSAATLVTLECVAQSNVVDDGVAVATVTTVTNQLTAAAIATGVWQDTTAGDFTTALSVGKSVMNGVSLGTGLTVASVSGAVGSVTGAVGSVTGAVGSVTGAVGSVTGAVGSVTGAVGSVTGAVGSVTGNVGGNVVGSVASVTAAVTLPSIPANWITATGITAAALNGKGDWPVGKTGYSLTQTFPTNFSAMAITAGGAVTAGTVSDKTGYSLTTSDWAKAGDAMTLTVAYDAAKTALTVGGYTAPDNASVTAIKAKTDNLGFTLAGKLDSNILAVNGVTVNGSGTAISPWGP